MRMGVVTLLAGLLALLVLVAGCAGNQKADQGTAGDRASKQTARESTRARAEDTGGELRPKEGALEMKGTRGTEFSGSCTVGDEEKELNGKVPERFVYELNGDRLECKIRNESAEGNLQVAFTAGGSRTVQQVSGGTLNLTYENGQISSTSSSDSGGQVSSSSSQVNSSSQSNSSSVSISP